jgi:hypothetical protein
MAESEKTALIETYLRTHTLAETLAYAANLGELYRYASDDDRRVGEDCDTVAPPRN